LSWLAKWFSFLQRKKPSSGAYPAERPIEVGDPITWYARSGNRKGWHSGWVTKITSSGYFAIDDRSGEKFSMIVLRGDRLECEW
jgi:hypothetical protein